jgi:hypothetical protein
LSLVQIESSWFGKEKGGNRKVGQSFLLFSVILSILSHSFFSQSFFLFSVILSFLSNSFYSQSFPQPDPTCRPFSLPFLLRRNDPDNPGEPLLLGPHAEASIPTLNWPRSPHLPCALTLAATGDPSTAAPFSFRSGYLGLTVVRALRRASDRHFPRKSFPSPSRSSPSSVPKPYASVSTGIREEAAAGEPLRRSNSSPPVPFRSC